MPDLILKALVKRHDTLLPFIYEFNFSPVHYVHQSWFEDFITPALFERLKKSSRARKLLSALILKKFDLQHQCFFDFGDQPRRLALLDGDSLRRLISVTGLAMNAERIARTIERLPLLAIKADIGEEGYWFALKKAPFMVGRRLSLPLPERQDSESWQDYVLRCGTKALEACLGHEPDAFTRRLQLKLPKPLAQDFGKQPKVEMKDEATFVLQSLLLKEVIPGWAPWFT
jgi:hypothetical protein